MDLMCYILLSLFFIAVTGFPDNSLLYSSRLGLFYFFEEYDLVGLDIPIFH